MVLALTVYTGSFFVVMMPDVPALDDNLMIVYDSSFKYGSVGIVAKGVTVEYRKECAWNLFYWPIDILYHKVRRPDYQSFYYRTFRRSGGL